MQLYPSLSGWSFTPGNSTDPNPADDQHSTSDLGGTKRHGSVMIVEDDDAIRDTLADILEYEGYTVLPVRDGREALTLLRGGSKPALILLDLMMPRMSGWEFRVEQLRSQEFAGIPVVLLSGAYDARVQAVLLEVREVLGKPIEVQKLLEVVRRFCG